MVTSSAWRLLSAALVVNGFVLQPAHAQHMNAPGSPCKEVAATSDLVRCLDKALHVVDSSLNKTYSRIQKALEARGDAQDIKNLVQAEHVWIQFRDSACEAEHSLYEGGSGGPPAQIACLEAQTRYRESGLLETYGWILEKWGM